MQGPPPPPPIIFKTPPFAHYGLAWSPFHTQRIALASAANYGLLGNGRLHLASVIGNQIVLDKQYDTQDGLYDVAWSEVNDNHIATASGDGSIKLWDVLINDLPIRSWREHTREVFSLEWSNIEKDVFASSSWDGSVKIWTPDRPHSLRTIPAHQGCVYQVSFSPHQPSVLASCATDGTVKIFDTRTPLPPTSVGPTPLATPSLTIPAHGTEALTFDWNKYRPWVLASAGVDRSIKAWDCRMVTAGGGDKLAVNQVGGTCENELRGHEYAVRKIQWSPHRPDLIASASYDMSCRVWTTAPPAPGKPSLLAIHDLHTEFVATIHPTMRVLCVAEKPSIAKAITQILSGGQFTTSNTGTPYIKNYSFDYPQLRAQFTVTSVTGHLFTHDFPVQYKKWTSCDPFELFEAPVERKVAEGKDAIANNLKQLARSHQQLVIWTDCDREGENIGSEVMNVCRSTNRAITVKRARFSAIIANQIHNAAQNPVELDMRQAASVDARSLLDLRLGAAFTRMQTLSLQRAIVQLAEQKLMSYGPCQFPTLGFVVSRYEQVQSFKSETFWYIYLTINRDRKETEFTWRRGRLFDFNVAMTLYEFHLDSPEALVTKVTKKNVKKWKPLPLTTVELQKSGSRLLRMTPKHILDTAEKLYQDGFLSYPRTETDQFDNQFDHMALIAKQTVDPAWGAFANGLQQGGFSVPRKGKKNDQAHPPIHPTAHAGNLTGDHKRVYEFVTRRYLACCSKDAEGFETTVDIVAGGEEFYATGLSVLARNYLDVYPYDKWGDKAIPNFEEGQRFMPSVCELKDGETTRPNLLTEADLVGLMDKNGIGTDATIAQHIQTIIDREYVVPKKEGAVTYLAPSTLGIGLVEGYNKIGFDRSLSKPQLRRETERMMVQVCEGTRTKQAMLDESIEQYKHVFVLARNQFGEIVSSVRKYVVDGGGPQNGNDSDGGSDDDDRPPGGGRGRGRGRGRGGAAPRARGRGRGRGAAPEPQRRRPPSPPPDDDDEDFWNGGPPPPPAPALRVQPPQPPRPPPSSQNRNPECECSKPALLKTVTRETANKGKTYWGCETNACAFFQWCDGPPRPPPPRPTAGVKRKSSELSGPFDEPSAIRRCKCDLTAIKHTVKKDGPNQGREFWRCPNSENAKCEFFEWDDAPPSSGNAVASGSRFGGGGNAVASGSGGNACYKCGEPGHFANACTNDAPPRRPAAAGGSSDRACFKCGQEGHFSNACTNPGAGSSRTSSYTGGGGGGGGKSGECFKCGQAGHWSNDCPNPGGSSSRGRGGSTFSKSRRGSSSRGRGRGKGKRTKSKFEAVDDY